MIAISAAVAYHRGDDCARRAGPLRTPPRPGLGAPKHGSFGGHSEAEALFFAGAALSALDSGLRSEPAVGRRLAPASGAEIRDRSGAEPAQPTRGRGGAPGRDRPREARPGARTGGTGLRRVPDARAVPTTLFAPSASPPSPPTCSRRSTRQRRRSSPPPCGQSARPAGRPQSPRPRLPKRWSRCGPTPSRLPSIAPTPRWPRPWVGQRHCRFSPASSSCAAPQARDGDRARAKPAGRSSWR